MYRLVANEGFGSLFSCLSARPADSRSHTQCRERRIKGGNVTCCSVAFSDVPPSVQTQSPSVRRRCRPSRLKPRCFDVLHSSVSAARFCGGPPRSFTSTVLEERAAHGAEIISLVLSSQRADSEDNFTHDGSLIWRGTREASKRPYTLVHLQACTLSFSKLY